IIGAAALVLFVLGLAGPVRSEKDPTISLVKTLVVREYEGHKITADEYTVKRNDSVAKILRQRDVIGPGPVPKKILLLVKALNPDLTNPNRILPGQKLILPVGPIEGPLPEPRPPEGDSRELKKPLPVETDKSAAKSRVDKTKYKVHMVRRGERLSILLRNMGLPDSMIFDEYLNITLKLNPRLSNPNLIYTGQRLKLPIPGSWSETTVAVKDRPRKKPLPAPKPPAITKIAPAPKPVVKKSPPKLVVPAPQPPPSKSLAMRTALGLIFSRIGERFLSTGQHFLPLKSGGRITISAQSFPIIEMRGGQRIVLDLDQRLPKEMVSLIRSNWSNYIIFRPGVGEKLPDMLGRLFELGRYYKVLTQGRPWMLRREVKVKITADWIIWPSQDDWAAGRAVVITLPRSRTAGTSPEVAAYLTGQGVKVIDFHPKGNLIGPEPRRGPGPGQIKVEDLTPEDMKEFVQAVLDLVGQRFELDLSIPLIMSTGSGKDYNFTVQAPIYFNRNGANFIVALDGLAPDMQKILEDHGFKIISRDSAEGARDLAQKLLKAMNVKTETGLNIKASSRPGNRNIEVVFPGLLIDLGPKRLLLTQAGVPPELSPLLARPNLEVVKYRITGPES
ncbi:MAG: LysM peptidoglycan-binding domain-containing protein, partial [Thermodesulfobacteriota bacterium]|nr:LysM peptidoglycan-binding domain-containing protein [Thermodesulfobacteriota bacterium]